MILVYYFKILIIFGIAASNSPLQNRLRYTNRLNTQTYFKNLVIKDLTPENNWQAKIVSAELSMVLFYVPWDEESLLAISIFNDLANAYHNRAYLFGVNCWDYKHYCANFFDESRWPSLRVYIKGKTKIQFNGLWSTPSLEKFIEGILVPLKRIQNDYDVSVIDKSYAHLVIGYFSNSESPEYQLYVHSSLKWLETDPYQSTRFAVYLDPTIKTPIVNGYGSQMMQINEKTTLYDINSFVLRTSYTSLYRNSPHEQIKTLASLALNGPVILLIYYNNRQKHKCMLRNDYESLCQMSCHKFVKRIEKVFQDNSPTDVFLKTVQGKILNHNILMGIQTQSHIPGEAFTSCRYENSIIYNKTTSYFLINADVYDELLFQLVGNGLKTTKNNFIIAIDNKDEAVYTLTKNFSYKTVSSFVDDLYDVNLTPKAKYVNTSRISFKKEDKEIPNIIDINTSTFLEMLSSNNSTLVAAMYSKNCPLCTHLLHILLQVSIRLNVKELQFVRINTDDNDMPWTYNVQSNPTLYVFPKNMSMDSRVFPNNVKINFRNVLTFILLYLDPSELMIATVNICQQMLLSSMSSKCMKFAERFFYNEVNQHLMSWQTFETKRKHILEMLQTLKAIGNNLLKAY